MRHWTSRKPGTQVGVYQYDQKSEKLRETVCRKISDISYCEISEIQKLP